MRDRLWIKGFLIGVVLLLFSMDGLITAQPQGASDIQCDITHEGDLILQGNDVLAIENKTYCLNGNLQASGDAKVTLRNGTLFVRQAFLNEHRIFFSGQSRLEMHESTITSDYEQQVLFSDRATGLMIHSVVGGTKGAIISLSGNASVSIQDSDLQVSPYGIVISESANLSARNSTINLHLALADTATATLTSLRPGLYSDWNLHRDNDVQGVPFDITLVNTTVEAWNFRAGDAATVTLQNCEFVHFGVYDQARVTLKDSTIKGPIFLNFYYWQMVEINNLRSGFVANWGIHDNVVASPDVTYDLVIENSEISSWDVSVGGAHLTIRDSSGFSLSLHSGGYVTVVDSNIDWLGMWEGTGWIAFDRTSVNRVSAPVNTFLRWRGTANFINKEVNEGNGPWRNSTITREFPVLVQDSTGSPLRNVDLKLLSPQNELIWSGKSDSRGETSFEITFNDTNYQDKWILKATLPNGEVITRSIGFLTDTPVEIRAGA